MKPCIFLIPFLLAAQQPNIRNATVQTHSAASGLDRQFQSLVSAQTDPAWIGYAVPAVRGRHGSDACCAACGGTVYLESSGTLFVLLRVEQRAVTKVRTSSNECDLDAGGLPLHWLTDVRPAESLALLSTLAPAHEGAVTAIALHADPAADPILERFVAAGQPEKLRERATFWLGAAREKRGYEVLNKLVREDSSDRIREKAVFALSVSPVPEAVESMISAARNDQSPRVRGQALFWLAHKAGQKAVGAITEAIDKDPETEVKKRAVFALSQLPKDESVRLLVEVARTNRNPAVRKQAMFWLGQSKDPRALAFFEEILTR